MDWFVFLALLQDGITTGAIYLLLAIGLLIVFSVTRVIFVPQGDLLAFGTLTVAALQSGHLPGTLWLLDGALGAGAGRIAVAGMARGGARRAGLGRLSAGRDGRGAGSWRHTQVPAISILLALAIVTPMGPLIWRFAFRPIADASVLALLILSMALHFVLIGLGLVFFGPEEASAPALTDASFDLGVLNVSGQSLAVLLCCAVAGAGPALVLRRHDPRQGAARRRVRPAGRAAGRASTRAQPARWRSGWRRSLRLWPAC